MRKRGQVVPYFFSFLSMVYVSARVSLTSLERLLELHDVPQERASHLPADPPRSEWPTRGQIEFERVCVRYRPGLERSLRQFTAKIKAGSKTAIVGRVSPLRHTYRKAKVSA